MMIRRMRMRMRMMIMIIMIDDRATQDCMYRYIMYPVTFIDDDCIVPPDKGSYIHYIVVFAIITYTYMLYSLIKVYKARECE